MSLGATVKEEKKTVEPEAHREVYVSYRVFVSGAGLARVRVIIARPG